MDEKTTDKKCEECKYFLPDTATGTHVCRRYAPRAICTPDFMPMPNHADSEHAWASQVAWPAVAKDDWCGEFEVKKPAIKYPNWEDMNWSVRPKNCLRRVGITSVEELIQYTKQQLSTIKNLGGTSLREIERKLANHNLSLATVSNPNLPQSLNHTFARLLLKQKKQADAAVREALGIDIEKLEG